MWLYTDKGFYSVVKDEFDDQLLWVRSRASGDLERLMERVGNVQFSQIYEDAGTDYRFRASVSRDDFMYVMALFVADIDYENFKDCVAERLGKRRADALVPVWINGLMMQEELRSEELERKKFLQRPRPVVLVKNK